MLLAVAGTSDGRGGVPAAPASQQQNCADDQQSAHTASLKVAVVEAPDALEHRTSTCRKHRKRNTENRQSCPQIPHHVTSFTQVSHML
jgi:hypothetical protein